MDKSLNEVIEEIVANKQERVQFPGHKLCHDQVVALARALKGNSSVTTLILFNQQIDAKGTASLSSWLSSSRFITILNLCSCGLGVEGAAALADGLSQNVCIIKLDLSNNGLGGLGCESLAKSLACCRVKELSLSRNDVGVSGVASLAKLQAFERLSKLELSHNNIGDEGAAILGVPGTFSFLQTLVLCGNNIGDSGCISLCRGLPTSLKSLNLDYNKISQKGAEALVTRLPHLSKLDLYENMVREEALVFSKALEHNGMLLNLTISGCNQDIQMILYRNSCTHERVRSSVVAVLLVWNFRRTTLLNVVPKDVMQLIAKDLWGSRGETKSWSPEIKDH